MPYEWGFFKNHFPELYQEICAERSGSEENSDDLDNGTLITTLPKWIGERLATVGRGKVDDASREDSILITAMLREGYTAEDVYATFEQSKRGEDARERK